MPSNPRITSFWVKVDAPREDEPEQASDAIATTRAASRANLRMGTCADYTPRAICDSADDVVFEPGRRVPSMPMRALGIDYGDRRIGLALSDATGLLASPWKRLANDGNAIAAARRLADEIRVLQADESGLGAVVIGLPRRLNGDAHGADGEGAGARARTGRADRDSDRAPGRTPDQSRGGRTAGATRARLAASRKDQVDAMAAALILQDYLDSRPRP